MFERYTEAARQAVVLAQEATREAKNEALDVPHLILGIILQSEDMRRYLLKAASLSESEVRSAIARLPKTSNGLESQLKYTQQATIAIELASREASTHGGGGVQPVHIVLSIIRYESHHSSTGTMRSLLEPATTPSALYRETVELLGSDGTESERKESRFQITDGFSGYMIGRWWQSVAANSGTYPSDELPVDPVDVLLEKWQCGQRISLAIAEAAEERLAELLDGLGEPKASSSPGWLLKELIHNYVLSLY